MSRLLRLLSTVACLLLVSAAGIVVTTGAASAASTLLCSGYTGCTKAKMSNDGYSTAGKKMWWRMYAGHNCTNYVAYRMVRSGMPNVRPWTGSGNASNWGAAKKSLTNATPTVGAVAWWRANANPAGSAGHVAYVERVVSANEIIVSQDSWGGDFSWRRIPRGAGSWPSGFIHFHDVPLANTTKPTVSGSPKVGAQLTASPGTWTPSSAKIAYQWLADGVAIAKATGPTLQLTLAQQGKRISIRTTASSLGYPTTAVSSAATSAVASGAISNTTRPAVIGAAKVDSTLTASPGTWAGAPTLSYQWSTGRAPIKGATGRTLVPGAALLGKVLKVTVTASKPGYTAVSSTSVLTGTVAPGTFTMTQPLAVVGTRLVGSVLSLRPGSFAPNHATVSTHWLRAGVPVAGPARPTYRVTTADLGSRMRAQMTLSAPGYTTLTRTSRATRLVRSPARMRVVGRAGKASVRIAVHVAAVGVNHLTGKARITRAGKVLRTLTLRNGAASTTLKRQAKGTRTYVVRYAGSTSTTVAAARSTVRIR